MLKAGFWITNPLAKATISVGLVLLPLTSGVLAQEGRVHSYSVDAADGGLINITVAPGGHLGDVTRYKGDPISVVIENTGRSFQVTDSITGGLRPFSATGGVRLRPFNIVLSFTSLPNAPVVTYPGIFDVRTPEEKAVAPRFTRSVFTNGFVTYGDPDFPNGWVRVYAIFENVLPANAVFEYYDGSTWRSTTGTIGLKHAILKVSNTNVSYPLLRLRANGVTNNFGYARPTTSKTFTQPAQRPYVRPSSTTAFPTYRFQIQNKTATMGVRG